MPNGVDWVSPFVILSNFDYFGINQSSLNNFEFYKFFFLIFSYLREWLLRWSRKGLFSWRVFCHVSIMWFLLCGIIFLLDQSNKRLQWLVTVKQIYCAAWVDLNHAAIWLAISSVVNKGAAFICAYMSTMRNVMHRLTGRSGVHGVNIAD